MNKTNKIPLKKYDKVMPRVYNRSCYGSKTSAQVIRHVKPIIRVGAKSSVSNVSSSVFSELPVVLNDYTPELSPRKVVRRTTVVKPRKTVTSLDPVLSPNRSFKKSEEIYKNPNLKSGVSATSLKLQQAKKDPELSFRHCLSSRSHTKLRELKDEIKAYNDKEKLLRLRCNLYKKCGVVFDDVGCAAADKAVQVENVDSDKHPEEIRSQQRDVREDAGTALSDQQVSSSPQYPVDRYMVHSSKNIEMVNIISDDLWNPEPALRPEDEIILRRLHDMLQSTSDDLKLLSGELTKFHEPAIQIKTVPTPLDEEFNEKVHIEELVNEKFHGYKRIDKSSCVSNTKVRNNIINDWKPPITKPLKPKVTNTAVQVNSPIKKKAISRNLGVSGTKIIQVNEKSRDNVATERLNNGKMIRKVPAVSYKEFSFNYVEPKIQENHRKKLHIQIMPSINIRSELTERRVLNIDILPSSENKKVVDTSRTNVVVVNVNHEEPIKQVSEKIKADVIPHALPESITPLRKVSKMSTGESSESVYVSSDSHLKYNTNGMLTGTREFQTTSTHLNRKKKSMKVKDSDKTQSNNLEEWRRKLNLVYAGSTSKNVKTNHKFKGVKKKVSSKSLSPSTRTGLTNNAEYIPYSQLTLGGIRVSDIEKELTNIPLKSNKPLNNILNEILGSKEHSTRGHKSKDIAKVLTTSDENLLQEVIDIERTVSDTISKNITRKEVDKSKNNISSNENDENDSYADDFEDVNSDNTTVSKNAVTRVSSPQQNNCSKNGNTNGDNSKNSDDNIVTNLHKPHNSATFTKNSNLSIKDSVEIFEFIHSVDTQDIATQSNTSNKIAPKETQTSPRNDKSNLQPIHNDLWPAIVDPRGEIEKMLTLEKEFIKKLIVDEYGDLLEKNIAKQSTAIDVVDDSEMNVVVSQKNTQTSPARVKNVMTSPKRTKTRTTSPFGHQPTVTAAQQTSPVIITNDEANDGNQDITINLSSPRFSLRLPQNSREVISNLDAFSQVSSKILLSKSKKFNSSSSSSVEAGSSSELSSLGEVRLPVRRRLKKSRVPSISESSSSSIISKCSSSILSGGVIPLRSEGEVSLGQRIKKPSNKSEGETSFGNV